MRNSPRRVEDPDDPALDPFRDLKGARGSTAEVIIEGELAVGRALAGRVQIHTVVTTPARRAAMASRVGPAVDWLEVDPEVLEGLTGFPFHRGVMAAAGRPSGNTIPLDRYEASAEATLILAEGFADPSNVGALVRNAAALGGDLVIVAGGADPFCRRAIRASAGWVLDHPVVTLADASAAVAALRRVVPGLEVIATTVCATATPLSEFRRRGPVLVMFGNEGRGLSGELIEAADRELTIEMVAGIDSLNAAASSAVFLWALGRPCAEASHGR